MGTGPFLSAKLKLMFDEEKNEGLGFWACEIQPRCLGSKIGQQRQQGQKKRGGSDENSSADCNLQVAR